MEPLLKQSDAGRAVFVTSGAANKASAYLGPYAASKGRARNAGAGLGPGNRQAPRCASTCSIPARSGTRMRATVFPGEDPLTLDTPGAGRRIHRADVRA